MPLPFPTRRSSDLWLSASDAGIGVVEVEIVNPRDTLERSPATLGDRVRDFGPVESAALVAARFAGEEIAEFGISAEVRRIGCGRQLNSLLQPLRFTRGDRTSTRQNSSH